MGDLEKAIPSEGNEADVEDVDSDEQKSLNAELVKVIAGEIRRIKLFHDSPNVASWPVSTKRRIKALKKMQLQCTNLEVDFYKEVHGLECKYAALCSSFYEKRYEIVTGRHVPTDEECDFPSDVETDDEFPDEVVNHALDESQEGNVKGIPGFWLTIFQSVDMLSDMVQEHDEPVLLYLSDVKVKLADANPMGFSLEFLFDPNEYFTNSVLTKEYEMRCAVDENEPFSFDGPEIFKCKGSVIDWKKGKDVTVRTIKKKQKHKQRGLLRTVTKTVNNDSFFNFFNPPINEDAASLDEETRLLLSADFEIGHFIRERLVPRAVLFFTGEALMDFDDEDEEDLQIEDEDEEDLVDEEEDEAYKENVPST